MFGAELMRGAGGFNWSVPGDAFHAHGPIFVPDWCSKLVLRGAQFPSKGQQEQGHIFLTTRNEPKPLRGALRLGQMIKVATSIGE